MLNYQQQEKRDTMASVGIIAEYNPFHNGHLYQIQEIKKKYPEDTIVIAKIFLMFNIL